MQSFLEKQKSVDFGPKMSYMKTFKQKSEKMQIFVEINILQLLDQKYFIWVFYFENIISCVKFMQLCMCDI